MSSLFIPAEVIRMKRDGAVLTDGQIKHFIDDYTSGKIPDYQMSALLMAIYFKGLNEKETYALTQAMINTGSVIDLSSISEFKVDKHSTGGVGDKTSMVLGPLGAAAGCTRFAGPLAVRETGRPDGIAPDGQRYSIDEQQRRGRERYAIPEDDWRIGPKTNIDRSGPIGR